MDMKTNTQLRCVTSDGIEASGTFGLSAADSTHIMIMLRDTLYTDRPLAVMREYGTNAWDAHREAGKPDLPIKVTIPSYMDPTLVIRDFGLGLSENDIFRVYTQYGASTKRDTDNEAGNLGIGSKSGFCYTDSFTITSCHGGMKRTYVAVLDPTETGVINRLMEEPCGEETGIEIRIPIRREDIWQFQEKARWLFSYYRPRPEINIELPPVLAETAALQHGSLTFTEGGRWVAVMGCVPYRLNPEQLFRQEPNGPREELLRKMSGSLFFRMGEVQYSASREELKYTPATLAAIYNKVDALVEEFVRHTLACVSNSALPTWEKRVRLQVLGDLKFKVPSSAGDLLDKTVKFTPPKHLVILHGKAVVTSLQVSPHTRILIRDDSRSLRGFKLGSLDYVAHLLKGGRKATILAELTNMAAQAKMDGIPIQALSSLPWEPRLSKRTSAPGFNPKHLVSTFQLRRTSDTDRSRGSRNWDIVDRIPDPTDVFVRLSHFQCAETGWDFYDACLTDQTLASYFEETLPPIYGYKTTEKKPVAASDCVGVPYSIWRRHLYSRLTSRILPLLALQQGHRIAEFLGLSQRIRGHEYKTSSETVESRLNQVLGPDHPLLTMYTSALQQAGEYRKKVLTAPGLGSVLGRAQSLLGLRVPLVPEWEALKKDYPLFNAVGWNVLHESNAELWIDYIQTMDRIRCLESKTPV